jgi:hypothetical protein
MTRKAKKKRPTENELKAARRSNAYAGYSSRLSNASEKAFERTGNT